MSGRIYLVIGQKLKFRANPGNALAYPAGWVSTDPNFPILHDLRGVHLRRRRHALQHDHGRHAVRAAGDLLSGAQQQRTGRLRDGGRAAVFAALSAQAGFGGLVLENLRAISPGHGLNARRFDANYLASYIDEVWQHYRSNTMTVTMGAATFTGRVSGEQFIFSGGVRPFTKPSTRDVLFCDGALAAPNDGVTGPVAAALGAGFNRGVLTSSGTQPVADPAAYYRRGVTNHYSRVMHENTVDGKAYGFAFDDVCDHALHRGRLAHVNAGDHNPVLMR